MFGSMTGKRRVAARWRCSAGLDVHVERLAVVGHRHGRFVVLAAGRDREDRVAEADAGELEGGPVQIGVELVGDGDVLGRGGGRGGVLEVDLVGEERCPRRRSWTEP